MSKTTAKESMETGRDTENYNPIVSQLHTMVMSFRHDLGEQRITAKFRNWLSKYEFDNYLPDVRELSLDINIAGSNYESFNNDHGAAITAANDKMREIFSLNSDTHDLKWLDVDGENRVMQIYAEPLAGQTDILNPKRSDVNDAFNLTIQANKGFLESVGGALLQHAAGKEGGFWKQVLDNKIRQMQQSA